MYGNHSLRPINNFSGPKKCLCCKSNVPGPNIYGSGRFCSNLCNQLRTPEAHHNYMVAHPDEYAAFISASERRA